MLFDVRALLLVALVVGVGESLRLYPVSWFDGLARILSKVEDTGVWPERGSA